MRTARRRADPHRRPSPLGPPALSPGNLANPARQGLRSPNLSGDPGDGRGKGGVSKSYPDPERYLPEQTGQGMARGAKTAAAASRAAAAAATASRAAAAAAAPEA